MKMKLFFVLTFLLVVGNQTSFGQCSNPSYYGDCDGDGVINGIDQDDDNDGISDDDECAQSTNVEWADLGFTDAGVSSAGGQTINNIGPILGIPSLNGVSMNVQFTYTGSATPVSNLIGAAGSPWFAIANGVGSSRDLIITFSAPMEKMILSYDPQFTEGERVVFTTGGGTLINPGPTAGLDITSSSVTNPIGGPTNVIAATQAQYQILDGNTISLRSRILSGGATTSSQNGINLKIYYRACDTDGDGIPDHQDLDSDDDGCYDVLEAGYTDQNYDGILGTIPVVVSSSNGRVTGTAVIDGYTGTSSAVTDGVPANTPDCAIVLPVEWCGLEVQNNNCALDVIWKTCSEKDVDYFEVVRSYDGVQWSSVGPKISAVGNTTSITEYKVKLEYDPSEMFSYYKIKQVDVNGQFSFSQITSVQHKPCSHTTYAIESLDEIRFYQNNNSVFIVIDNLGKVVYESTTVEGVSDLEIHLSIGVYYVRMFDGTTLLYRKVR